MWLVSRIGVVRAAAAVAAFGMCLGGCGRLGDALSGEAAARDCHPDPETVAALRQEPVLHQAPPGSILAAATETVSCGWDSSKSINLGMLDSEVSGAGAASEVSRFYADLVRSGGWQVYDQSTRPSVFDAVKPDGTGCSWHLQVRETVDGTYQVQITYTPRDLRPTCL